MHAASALRAASGAVLAMFVLAPAGARPEAAGGPIMASIAGSPVIAPVTPLVQAAACAATPQDAWTLAQKAVATGDAGLVTERLTPDYRARNALEMAIGASMLAEIGEMSGSASSPQKAAAAKAAEVRLKADLDTLLRKYKAPTMKDIGTPYMMKLNDPATQAKFAAVDHVGLAREMEGFFRKVEQAAEAAGVKGEQAKLDELVVGYGDLHVAPTAMKVTGDTATLPSGKVTMRFKKVAGCWLVDGRD
jgi:hypothetical protein